MLIIRRKLCAKFSCVLARFQEIIKSQSFEFSLSGVIPANVQDMLPLAFFVFFVSFPDPGRRDKINLKPAFQIFLCCLKRFYVGLKGLKNLHKTFLGVTKKCKNRNFS